MSICIVYWSRNKISCLHKLQTNPVLTKINGLNEQCTFSFYRFRDNLTKRNVHSLVTLTTLLRKFFFQSMILNTLTWITFYQIKLPHLFIVLDWIKLFLFSCKFISSSLWWVQVNQNTRWWSLFSFQLHFTLFKWSWNESDYPTCYWRLIRRIFYFYRKELSVTSYSSFQMFSQFLTLKVRIH